MNIIYLHGFKSNSFSIKGGLLKDYYRDDKNVNIHLPDLNMSPIRVIESLSSLIEHLDQVALVGSSLGGFYATQLVAKYGVPAVLINPAMRPWQLFRNLFGREHLPYQVTEDWALDDAQLDQLEQMAVPFVQDADKILVLLQQGDEVLDYREAQRYYSAEKHRSMIITEANGNHAMEDFAEKIPMAYQFLSDCIK
ncbi:YqiA/YcfP family alpha/beta fold hydrolase [Acinetobacter shaoyimingii]|uniref:Esterase n=1 Tax=Acinetobacter shaoyimingii TaxID=2715164 RepID=A0A6G8RZE5_9GAMM|nr:YqiA/YcfP family alpha/beta fold hydrolase [Acinetobacter shaoyimingii]QIO07235.1 esterase [Acinetobacter shaoyimingii]